MLLKVCGLRERDNVEAVLALQPEWVGFIFEPTSPRYFLHAHNLASGLNIYGAIKKVGVFVNQDADVILNLKQQYALDLIQLHGDESVAFCKQLKQNGIKIIKAFSINDLFEFSELEKYAPYVTLFLFDAQGPLRGGNGIPFNWELLKKHRFAKPFLLSGGIGPDSLAGLRNFSHPDMIGVDVNSKFEVSPGIKNTKALYLFQQQIA
jgi:phosphoribosylanthranilate isomerase